jgi:DNA polymerase sigma
LTIFFIFDQHFAKRHGVGDASKGMLSSYAWALLMIQFLQLRFAENGSPILPAAELPALLQQCLDSGISVPTEVRCQIGVRSTFNFIHSA